LSTWGHVQMAGLTEIEVFDIKGHWCSLVPAYIKIRNASSGPQISSTKLIDGEKQTCDEKHMWLCTMPAPPACLELCIYIPLTNEQNKEKREDVGSIKMWNYNKSLLDSVKGFKEVEVLFNEKLIWKGIVKKGTGNALSDF
jgi:hypothetical protein